MGPDECNLIKCILKLKLMQFLEVILSQFGTLEADEISKANGKILMLSVMT